MVYFSADRMEVENLAAELSGAGIACQVREGLGLKRRWLCSAETELWIRHDRDCTKAFSLFVYRHAGFAKRPAERPDLDSWPEPRETGEPTREMERCVEG
jgi:hypothetical protein